MNKPLPPEPTAARIETADDYRRVVVRLNPRWRIIECRDGVQRILQYRASAETYSRPRWQGRSYCRTREVLIRCCREYAGAFDPAAAAILTALPERIETVAGETDMVDEEAGT